jgi:3-oxoacyl-[acyl-carrier protein] reductase
MTPLLEDKNAIVYGGSGSVGGAVARAFASEGERVFLAGRLFNRVPTASE